MRIFYKILVAFLAVVLLGSIFTLPHWNLPEVAAGEGDGSVQVYYISLDKAENRRQELIPKLEELELPYERIHAIYGKDLPQEEKNKVVRKTLYTVLMRRAPLDGEIGCYLSHLKAWQTFLKSNHSYALILEDDAKFNPDELRDMVNLLIQNKDKWDYVNLDPHRPGNGRIITRLSEERSLLAPRQRVWMATGQLINRKAAATLIKHALPIVMPLDHYIYRSWELGYKYRIVYPKVVGQDFKDTYIGGGGYSRKIYLRLSNRIYVFITGVMSYITASFQ